MGGGLGDHFSINTMEMSVGGRCSGHAKQGSGVLILMRRKPNWQPRGVVLSPGDRLEGKGVKRCNSSTGVLVFSSENRLGGSPNFKVWAAAVGDHRRQNSETLSKRAVEGKKDENPSQMENRQHEITVFKGGAGKLRSYCRSHVTFMRVKGRRRVALGGAGEKGSRACIFFESEEFELR